MGAQREEGKSEVTKGSCEGAKLFALRGSRFSFLLPPCPRPLLPPLGAGREREVVRASRFARREARSYEPCAAQRGYLSGWRCAGGRNPIAPPSSTTRAAAGSHGRSQCWHVCTDCALAVIRAQIAHAHSCHGVYV